MARTPMMDRLQAITRRELLGAAGAATAAAAVWNPRKAFGAAPPNLSVGIVGGGLAGLTCAYRLKQAGLDAKVFEASDRFGGRCWTLRPTDAFALSGSQTAELGGELIDSGHLELKHLVQELGLPLDNLLQAEPNGSEPFYYFDGRPYTEAQAEADLNGIYQALHKDVSAASYPTTYKVSTLEGQKLDLMSIYEWIESRVPGGHRSALGQLLDVAYNIEYGAETTDQSALNLLYLLGYSGQGQLRMFGPSNEKFRVQGGNDRVVQALVSQLGGEKGGQLVPRKELTSVRQGSAGVTLGFRDGTTRTFDRVVLALPFSILRSVDTTGAQFSAVKKTAIKSLGMGTNSKLQLGFTKRRWHELGCNGETYADTGYQNTWDVSRAQAGTNGILVDYTGGKIGASFNGGTPTTRAQQFLGQLEPVLPGVTKAWNGKAHVMYWTGHQWTKGSYSYYRVGQYQAFGGAEAEIERAIHFAGEHTTQDYQGYLNGAVYSGERAANEVLAS